ncbi:response regulator transcription factor [Shiella aurantiaca]|nr:response regulator transcription factor [Shiella aurantiaca]
MEAMRIVLADDHEIIRDGLKALILKHPGYEIVGEANNGQEALEQVKALQPDIVIMDISMPVMNGMEAARQLHSDFPEVKTIILSMHREASYITQCMDYHVMGYVLKDEAGKEIIHALQAVQQGRKFYSDLTTKVIFEKFAEERTQAPAAAAPSITLTQREMEIMKHIAEGKTNHQIADTLFISFRTVETHRANLMKKLNAKNSIELINQARKEGIIK